MPWDKQVFARRAAVPVGVLLLLLLATGCDQLFFGSNNTITEVLGTQVDGNGILTTEDSTPVSFDENGKAILSGTIEHSADIDAFDLGSYIAGDTFHMSFALDGGFDAVAALFDADSGLVMLNDDSYDLLAPTAPLISFTARSASDHLYLVIATSPKSASAGSYSINVTRTFSSAPVPESAVVVMDWSGASGVTVGGRGPVTVPQFQGSFIDPVYAGDTQALIDATVAYVAQDFEGLNVSFYVDGDPNIPDVPYSTIYFGTYNSALLGLADSVDYYNGAPVQNAIIYTDSFALFMPLAPSVDEMAQALANVASHEIGHLLGLNHTQDPTSIMDITATAYQLMQDEAFRRSLLNVTIFPTGYQHAVVLLLNTVGGTADPNATRLAGGVSVKLNDPKEARRAWIGSIRVSKDFFCAHKCSPQH